MGIANFDVVPTDDIFEVLFNFTETPPYTTNMVYMGMETHNMISNLGTMFLFVLIGIALMVWLLILGMFSFIERVKLSFIRLKRSIFFNMILRFCIESYLELGISCIV